MTADFLRLASSNLAVTSSGGGWPIFPKMGRSGITKEWRRRLCRLRKDGRHVSSEVELDRVLVVVLPLGATGGSTGSELMEVGRGRLLLRGEDWKAA